MSRSACGAPGRQNGLNASNHGHDNVESAIDLITDRPDGTFVLYLIEQGPWSSDTMMHLHAIQDRVYACFDLVVNGELAAGHPDSSGRPVVIRVDAYDTPPGKVAGFVVSGRRDRGLAQAPGRAPALPSRRLHRIRVRREGPATGERPAS